MVLVFGRTARGLGEKHPVITEPGGRDILSHLPIVGNREFPSCAPRRVPEHIEPLKRRV
jgi:hypothetical protein